MRTYTFAPRLLVAALLLLSFPAASFAQSEIANRDWLVIDKIETQIVKKSTDAEITIKGKTKDIPAGTEVFFRLTFQSRVVAEWSEELRPGKFESKHIWKNPTIARQKFFLWTEIPLAEQKKSVRKAFEKDDRFENALAPWPIQHIDHQFRIDDPEALARLEAELAAFFHGHLDSLRSIEKASREKIAAFSKSADEEGAEEFEERDWRKFQNSKVIKPLRDIQKALAAADEAGTYRTQVAQLYSLREASRAIADSVLRRSKDLYEAQGLPWNKDDTEEDEHKLDTDHRARALKTDAQLFSYLKDHVKRINDGIPKPKSPKSDSKKDKDDAKDKKEGDSPDRSQS